MKHIVYTVVVSLLVMTSMHSQEKEVDLVRKSFNQYKQAILTDKGAEAANFVDSRTIQYYSDILSTTISADSTTVDALGVMDKLMVFSIRHRTPKEDILSFDGKQLLIHAIKEGMVGKNSVANSEIGEVEVDGDFAKGQFITNGQKAPFYFNFYKEDKVWKIDLTSIFPVAQVAFKNILESSGQEENEYFFTILELLTGKKPDHTIWNPIQL